MAEYAARKGFRPPVLVDVWLVGATLALVSFGILMIYSTTGILSQERYGDPLFFVKRQSVAAFIGVVAMLLASRLNVAFLRKISPYLLLVSLFLLCLPLIPGLGDRAGGASRWISVFSLRFQPAELVKVLFIIFIAGYFARREDSITQFGDGVIKPVLFVALVSSLLLLQPDFGSAAIIAIVTFSMGLAAGVRLRFILIGGLGLAACMALLIFISPYRLARVMSFMTPWADASGSGYQLIQSLIAVGSGQITGAGLGASQQKLFYLPAAHTDFIFAVIAEELGFLGGIFLLSCFMLFLWRGLYFAGRVVSDPFAYSLAVGLTLLIGIPALLNIGVVIGLLPTKGLVLPLVGFGGSSLIACMLSIGILLAVIRSHQKANL